MFDPNTITGDKQVDILRELQKNRTIISINLLGKGYEGLTIVTGIHTMNNIPLILIARPGGSEDYIQKTSKERVFLEFVDRDKIQYNFKTRIEKVGEDDILIQFPKIINRVQRRKHFRVEPPIGTRMVITADDRRHEVNVINMSMGGALICKDSGGHIKEVFFMGQHLKDIVLKCDENEARARITIKKAEIIRIAKIEETGRFCYALKFLEMDRDMTEQLHVFIYLSQRVILKRWSSISRV